MLFKDKEAWVVLLDDGTEAYIHQNYKPEVGDKVLVWIDDAHNKIKARKVENGRLETS